MIVGELFDLIAATRVAPTRWSGARATPPISASCSTGACGSGSSISSSSTAAGRRRAPVARRRSRPSSRRGSCSRPSRGGPGTAIAIPTPPDIDDAQAREVAIALVAAALAPRRRSSREPAPRRRGGGGRSCIVAVRSQQRASVPRLDADDSPQPPSTARRSSTPASQAALDAIAERGTTRRASLRAPAWACAPRDGATHLRGVRPVRARRRPRPRQPVPRRQRHEVVRRDGRVPTDRRAPSSRSTTPSTGTSRAGRTGIGSRSRCCSVIAAAWATSATTSASSCVRSCCRICKRDFTLPRGARPRARGSTGRTAGRDVPLLERELHRARRDPAADHARRPWAGSSTRASSNRSDLTRTLYGPDDLAAANKVVFHGLFDVTGNGTPVDIGGFPRNAALTVDPAGAGLFSSLPDLLTFTHALVRHRRRCWPPRNASGLDHAVSTLSAKDLLLERRLRDSRARRRVTRRADDRGLRQHARHHGRGLVQPPRSRRRTSSSRRSIAARDTFELAARATPPLTSGQRQYHERTGTPRRVSGGDGRDGYVGCAVAPPASEPRRAASRSRRSSRSALPRGPRHRPSRALRRSPRPSPTCRTPPSRSPGPRATAARRCSPTGPPANRATVPSRHPATADRRRSASVGSRSVGCTRARWPRGTGSGSGASSAPSAPFIPQLSDHRAVPGPPTFAARDRRGRRGQGPVRAAGLQGVRDDLDVPRGVHVEQRWRAGVGAQRARWPDPRRAPHAGQDLHVLRAGAEPVRVGLTLAAFDAVVPLRSLSGPAAPVITSVEAGVHRVSIVFHGPAPDAGGRINDYRATCTSTDGGEPATRFGRRSPVVVLGLSAGKTYTCTVTAHDSVGYGTGLGPIGVGRPVGALRLRSRRVT